MFFREGHKVVLKKVYFPSCGNFVTMYSISKKWFYIFILTTGNFTNFAYTFLFRFTIPIPRENFEWAFLTTSELQPADDNKKKERK